MPSLRTAFIVPRRSRGLPLALLGLGLGLGLLSASCDSLFGGYTGDNPDNCVLNAALCPAPDQTCNVSTKLCEPATILTAVDPPGGSNVGGLPVTISGSRFVAGMIVSFDGVPATAVTVNGAQQLTAMTPARPGRQGPVTVELVNPNGQHVQNDKLFRYYGEVTFQKQCFAGPSGAALVVATDLNKDGKTDLLITGSSVIRAYLSSGDGLSFVATADVLPGQTPLALLAADLNGDGKIDLTLPAAAATNNIATALGNGDGTFQAIVKTPTTQPAYGLALADVNGDQRLDALSLQNLDLVVQLGRGDGTFLTEQKTAFATQNARTGSVMTLPDLDGDGLPDAIPLSSNDQTLTILFGQTAGWAPPLTAPLAGIPSITFVSDYNQDGILDLAVGLNRTSARIELRQGLGGRQFGAFPSLMLKNNFRLQAQGDFNGDGVADLVTMDAGGLSDNLVIYLGAGAARFVAAPPLSVAVAAVSAAVGDWNGDGHQDLVTISNTGDSVCVLRTAP